MLLQHAWLAPLVKQITLMEEDEDEKSVQASEQQVKPQPPTYVVDREVAEWVVQALEKRRQGKLCKSIKPTLHAAPLDAAVTPGTVPIKANIKEGIFKKT
jgi:mitogen-activated protein kinase kinase